MRKSNDADVVEALVEVARVRGAGDPIVAAGVRIVSRMRGKRRRDHAIHTPTANVRRAQKQSGLYQTV